MSQREQELLDRIAELEDILGLTANFPPIIVMRDRGMSPIQAKLLGLLLARKFIPWDCAQDALYGDRPVDEMPERYAVSSVVKYLRKQLTPLGVSIETIYGEGLFMPEADKRLLFSMWPETKRLAA